MRVFTTIEDKREWIDGMLLDLREGEACVDEVESLRELLAMDRDARLFYLQANQLDLLLGAGGSSSLGAEGKGRRRFVLDRSQILSALVGAGVAAVMVLMILKWAGLLKPSSVSDVPDPVSSSVASLVSEHEAVFASGKDAMPTEFGEGEMDLKEGLAELAFRNGARVILDGQCGFEIVDEMTVILRFGKLWAYCPLEAHGFRVLTPGGNEIIDLGTEFGVSVSDAGETSVHVFDGLVEVKKKNIQDPHRVEAGQAMEWNLNSSENTLVEADFSKFVTAETLDSRRLEKYRAGMRERSGLLHYYDFSKIEGKTVVNRAANSAAGTEAEIIGAMSVTGRFEGSEALLFEHPGDALTLDVEWPTHQESFTTGMWVKVDRLSYEINTLFNSNGWAPGDIHFQVTRNGGLRSGIHGSGAFQTHSRVVTPGKWQFLAVSWDLKKKMAQFFCDGKVLRSTPFKNNVPFEKAVPAIGRARIGSWDFETFIPERNQSVRDFKGRIDEVMVFDRALSEDELLELYRSGGP